MARVLELDPAFRIAKISTPFRDPTITENMRAATECSAHRNN